MENRTPTSVHERQTNAASLPAAQPNKGMKDVPVVSHFLQGKPASVTERCRLIREFVSAQTECDLESLLREELPTIVESHLAALGYPPGIGGQTNRAGYDTTRFCQRASNESFPFAFA